MKPSSAKAKGRLLQQYVRDTILKQFPQLEPGDVRSTSMGAGGVDVQLSPAATKLVPYSIECKSLSRFAGYGYYDQSQGHVGPNAGTNLEPLVVVKQNGRKPLVLVDFHHFMELLK